MRTLLSAASEKSGDVLLSSGAVVEDLLGVRDVYLLCKLLDRGLLGRGETLELELLNGHVLLLLHDGAAGSPHLHRGGGGRVGVEREGGDEFLVFVHL